MPRARRTEGRERPHVPKPSEDAVKKGAPSARAGYIKEGVPIYRNKDAKNRIRFLAWADGKHFFYYLYVHRRIGFNYDSFACLAKNWNEQCPVCEDAKKQLDGGADYEDVREQGILPGAPRILAQVVDRDNEEAGVQVWDVTSYKIDNAIRSLSIHDDTGAVIPWTDPDEGYDLIYDYDSKSDYAMPENLRRSPSSTKLDVRFYEDVLDFDRDIIYKPTYEEVAESYLGGGAEDEDEPAPAAAGGGKEEPPGDDGKEEQKEETGGPNDPLDGGECFGKAYGLYEDCTDAEDPCPDAKQCRESQQWIEGESCPECGLPMYKVKGGKTCAKEHFVAAEKEAPAGGSRKRRRKL